MVRESKEELGLTPTTYQAVGIINFYFPTDPNWNMRCYPYLVSAWSGSLAASEEMKAPTWFRLTALPWPEMWPNDAIWLPHALNGEYVQASFLLGPDNQIVKHSLDAHPL
jgi:8-oxo-dGTP diphosphatase